MNRALAGLLTRRELIGAVCFWLVMAEIFAAYVAATVITGG